MNSGAWQATVHSFAQSLIRLKQLSTHTHTSFLASWPFHSYAMSATNYMHEIPAGWMGEWDAVYVWVAGMI